MLKPSLAAVFTTLNDETNKIDTIRVALPNVTVMLLPFS